MRECGIKGTIIEKMIQVVAYADDIALIARDRKSLEEAMEMINKKAKERGLEINQEKSKYMKITRKEEKVRNRVIKVGEYNMEEVESFKYLGTIINRKNNRSGEIDQKIQSGYKAYYGHKMIMNNKKISKKTKLRLYRTVIRPVVTYAAENICLTKREEEKLKIFERKIVRKIFGGKKLNEGQFRRLTNNEIEEILENENIVRIIKSKRIRWYGHINRMNEQKVVKKMTKWKPQVRPRGRPKIRWEEQVIEDIKKMRITGWTEKIKDRREWRKIVKETTRHKNL